MNTPTAVDRGRGRHLPDRPGDRDRRASRSIGAYQTSSPTSGIDLGQVPRRSSAATSSASKLEDKVVADAIEARPAARGRRDLPLRRHGRAARRKRSRSATSCTRPRTTRAPRRPARSPTTDPSWAAAKADADARVREGSRPIPTLFDTIARAESDEAERPGRDRHRRQAVGLLRAPTAATSSRSPSRSSRRASRTARSCRRSRRSSATTSSRSCNHAPDLAATQDPGRRRQRLRAAGPRHLRGPRGRRAAATSAGSPRASSTSG